MGKNGSEPYRLKVALVYYSSFSSFIKNDYDLLSKHFKVSRVNIRNIKGVFGLAAAISRCDLSFVWFAGKHAFPAVLLSKVLGKRSIVVAGGYDVACVPEINYGQFTLGWDERMYASFALNNADIVLAVSEFIRGEVLRRSNPRRLVVIYNGIDIDRFKPLGEKEDLIVTVASGSRNEVRLKGIDAFVQAAAYIPEAKFAVIGLREKDVAAALPTCIPENVEFIGHLPQEELIKHYQRAKVYCQLSYMESFGVALAEAMACECVPVVADRGGMPEVVGDAGFCVPYDDAKCIVASIEMALRSDSDKGKMAAERIRERFPLWKREKDLAYLIESLLGEK